jgi:hypothetical protein
MPRAHLIAVILISVGAACSSSRDDSSRHLTRDTACTDLDGDGVCMWEDCNDENPTLAVASTELCDGLDNDCDGEIDEGALTFFYVDVDGDEYGDPGAGTWECEAPKGYSERGDDCDDYDANIHPGAVEVCNGDDDDCDGLIDEDTTSVWYHDADSDGYGVTGDVEVTCSQPYGYAAENGDCDDLDPDIHPGAHDVCDDGVDNDCTGADASCVFSGEASLSVAISKYVGDESGERSGNELDLGDVNGDGFYDLWVAARESSAAASAGGEAYLVYGPSTGIEQLSVADTSLVGDQAEYEVGRGLDLVDLNGDGLLDLVAGAPHGSGGYGGGAYVLFAPPSSGVVPTASADLRLLGLVSGDDAGHGLAGGDYDGDGQADLAVGAYQADDGALDAGVIYVQSGPLTAGSMSLGDATAALICDDRGSGAGEYVSSGDVTDDGFDDVFASAANATFGPVNAGVIYVMAGPMTGTSLLSSHTALFMGEMGSAYAGSEVAVGDIDGDGSNDLLIGAYGDSTIGSSAGAAYVVHGPVTGDHSLSDAEAKLEGPIAGAYAGWSVATADADADGFSDVAVGALGMRSSAGAAFVLFGPVTGTFDLSTSDAVFYGEGPSDEAGAALDFGDTNGDGVLDLAVGAEFLTNGGVQTGGAYVVLGLGR